MSLAIPKTPIKVLLSSNNGTFIVSVNACDPSLYVILFSYFNCFRESITCLSVSLKSSANSLFKKESSFFPIICDSFISKSFSYIELQKI